MKERGVPCNIITVYCHIYTAVLLIPSCCNRDFIYFFYLTPTLYICSMDFNDVENDRMEP